MDSVLTIDGKRFQVGETTVHRNFELSEGTNSGATISGRMRRDLIGTFYSYTLTIETFDMAKDEYDALYELLSAPVESHTVTLPYGQRELTYQAYIKTGEDDLEMIDGGGCNLWGGLSVQFYATEPQRSAK